MTDPETILEIQEFKESGELIYADNAEPKTITYYQMEGFNMYPASATKSAGSRLQNTKKMKRFKKIYISDECPCTWEELHDLVFKKDRNGNVIPDTFNIDPHTFSAIWYSLEGIEMASLKADDTFFISY